LRVLIDESVPRHLAPELPGHDVSTVRAQGWSRLRNGVLLRAAVDAGFQVVVTADQSIPFQQNLAKIGIAVVVVLRVRNRMADLRPLIPRILAAIERVKPGEVQEVTR
jgi:hypothetical protein